MARRISRALTRLAQTGQGDLKRLHGRREWRLRVGDWRVRLDLDHGAETLTVLRVLPRGRAYRD
jgi:mRNA-degrading endonuclease RelE of RelBE toxin-antitoxin system